jgi:hypothetical protein
MAVCLVSVVFCTHSGLHNGPIPHTVESYQVCVCVCVCVCVFVSLSLIKCNKNPLHLKRVARTGQTKKERKTILITYIQMVEAAWPNDININDTSLLDHMSLHPKTQQIHIVTVIRTSNHSQTWNMCVIRSWVLTCLFHWPRWELTSICCNHVRSVKSNFGCKINS